MSLGGDNNPNNWYDLILTIFIGVAIIVFGLSTAFDKFYYSYIHGFIDLSKYHVFIGLVSVAFGLVYLFLALKNFLDDA